MTSHHGNCDVTASGARCGSGDKKLRKLRSTGVQKIGDVADAQPNPPRGARPGAQPSHAVTKNPATP